MGESFGHACGLRVDGVQREKVLKMDRPFRAGGFVSLTALRAEGGGLPLCGNPYKISVTGFTFSVPNKKTAFRRIFYLSVLAA